MWVILAGLLLPLAGSRSPSGNKTPYLALTAKLLSKALVRTDTSRRNKKCYHFPYLHQYWYYETSHFPTFWNVKSYLIEVLFYTFLISSETKCLFFFKKYIYLFTYLAALGLSCNTWDLRCCVQDLCCGMRDLLVAACGLLVVACMWDLVP